MRLRQAFLNLLSNANKFTDHGTISIDGRADWQAGFLHHGEGCRVSRAISRDDSEPTAKRATPPGGHRDRERAAVRDLDPPVAAFQRSIATLPSGPPKGCGRPRASLLGPGQSDFGRIDISTVKDALGSMQWDVDHRADADALQAAVLTLFYQALDGAG
jgi:hypothetical protein